MRGFILTSCQRKGGVGRSTLLYNLAGAFSKRGLRVLLVDLDPQSSISQICLGPEIVDVLPPERSVVALVDFDRYRPVEQITVASGIQGVDLVPGSNAMAEFDVPVKSLTRDLEQALCYSLADVRGQYDVVLCDTPPSLAALSWMPAVLADVALTPTPAEPLAVQELVHAGRFLDQARQRNPELRWAGIVLTLYQSRLVMHQSFAEALRGSYGDLVLNDAVPYAAIMKEMILARRPLSEYKPRTAAAKAIDAIARDILQRVCKLQTGGQAA